MRLRGAQDHILCRCETWIASASDDVRELFLLRHSHIVMMPLQLPKLGQLSALLLHLDALQQQPQAGCALCFWVEALLAVALLPAKTIVLGAALPRRAVPPV